ncbi:hypothetical protein V496_02097 [Pseudogymnoascus sp. VKM F-4515 (FW-2607)]|nr:hypothetical protein V496_02097 [Pseudogymnoascus sp. VKM F-4515 (FW-2607)]KFY89962.1 hypothetical protein V498_06234 [Pseudogymnoascus sp. VKM F-4517 (FW-2822)]
MVLKLDTWLKYHPGGQKTIKHLVGKDATDEINVMHSAETRLSMSRFQIGTIETCWKNFVPPIQGGIYRPYIKGSEEHQEEELNFDDPGNSRASSLVLDINSAGPRRRDGSSFLDSQTKEELALDLTKYPALDAITQSEIVHKYRLLGDQIQAEGLYDCNYTAYIWEAARCSFIFGMMLLFWKLGWYGTSGVFMGAFWSQLVFMAHDAGHMAITHNFTIDTIIGMTIASPLGGLSLGWWKATHNIHHIVTNAPEHDPDNQHLPFLAVNHRFLGNIFSSYHERILAYDAVAKFLVPYQAYMYYPLLTFGRFNLYVQSYLFLLTGMGPRKGQAWWHRWFEIAGNLIFWTWFGYGLIGHIPGRWNRFVFIMVSHMVTMPLHVQFTVSHFAMSATDMGPGESFPQKMLRTTMDVDCPQWLDFFHGGLQFQAIHHLYPRIPRHNLRRTQKLVVAFCKDVGIPYALYGFVDGNKEVIGRLAEVARQAAILSKCQATIAERGDLLHEL